LGINHIITLSPEAQPPSSITQIPNLEWTVIPVEDFEGATLQNFQAFFNICDKHLGDDSGAILVHCRGGNGRTGMFLAAYLMRRDSLSASAGIAAVRATRPHSIESRDQVDSLKELEHFLDQKE